MIKDIVSYHTSWLEDVATISLVRPVLHLHSLEEDDPCVLKRKEEQIEENSQVLWG
jgi:hypothetical protein